MGHGPFFDGIFSLCLFYLCNCARGVVAIRRFIGPASDDGTGTTTGVDPGGAVPRQAADLGFRNNHPPVAALRVTVNGPFVPDESITLDASIPVTPNGDSLTFAWSQVRGPSRRSSRNLPLANVRLPRVVENVSVTLLVTASDGHGGQSNAQVQVSVVASDEFAGHPQSALPYRDRLSSDEAWHLLRRAAFESRASGTSPRRCRTGWPRHLTICSPNRPVPPDVLATARFLSGQHESVLALSDGRGPQSASRATGTILARSIATSQRNVSSVDRPLALGTLRRDSQQLPGRPSSS